MSVDPIKAVWGTAFLLVALTAAVTGDGLGADAVWLWAAGFGAIGIAGVASAIIVTSRRLRAHDRAL
jgi:hypothetical protein